MKIWATVLECNVMPPIRQTPVIYRGRFAPSPTGPLHFGSLVAALGSWLHARAHGGEWLVRIEDVDRTREVPGTAEQQLEALRRFGLHWDGDVVRQSQRDAHYRQALDDLMARGLAFECHCSRTDLEATGGVHRHCVTTTRRDVPATRLRIPDATAIAFDDAVHGCITQQLDQDVGDVVLRRADGCWAYQLAVVVDDAAQDITDVVRGADLLDSTPRQIYLQQMLGLPTPSYTHLPLVLDDEGRKLSKSLASLPVDGGDPIPALAAAWTALGQDAAIIAGSQPVDAWLARAVKAFDETRLPRGPQPSPHRTT